LATQSLFLGLIVSEVDRDIPIQSQIARICALAPSLLLEDPLGCTVRPWGMSQCSESLS